MNAAEKIKELAPYYRLLEVLEANGFNVQLLNRSISDNPDSTAIVKAMVDAGKREAMKSVLGEPISVFSLNIPQLPFSIEDLVEHPGDKMSTFHVQELTELDVSQNYEIRVFSPQGKFSSNELFEEFKSRGAVFVGRRGLLIIYRNHMSQLGVDFTKELAHLVSFGDSFGKGYAYSITNYLAHGSESEIDMSYGIGGENTKDDFSASSILGNGKCLICAIFKK